MDVTLPYKPYPFMVPILIAPQRFLAIEAHRRCSKTMFACYWLIIQILYCQDWHPRGLFVGPTLENAVNAAWDYLTHFAGFVPGSRINVARREIFFINGGKIKLHGATDPDKVKGSYCSACVCDESAQHPPRMWTEVLRPMLNDKNRTPGRALFIGTTKGKSFFWELTQREHSDPEWKTYRFPASSTGVFSLQQLQEFRREMGDALYNQEFELDPHASIVGALLGRELAIARTENRITRVPYDPNYPVYCAFDLGVGNNMVIWFAQRTRFTVNVLDYHEGNLGVAQNANLIKSKNYCIEALILPHDGANRQQVNNLSLGYQYQNLGFKIIQLQRGTVGQRLDAARSFMSQCVFDANKCAVGLDHLNQFRVVYDDRIGLETERIDKRGGHDHAFDAFSHLALGIPENAGRYTNSELYSLRERDTYANIEIN
jgi:hypothetical protein